MATGCFLALGLGLHVRMSQAVSNCRASSTWLWTVQHRTKPDLEMENLKDVLCHTGLPGAFDGELDWFNANLYTVYIYIDKPQTTEQPILMYSVLSRRCIMSSSVREAQEACTSFGHMSFFHFDLQQCSNSHFPLFQAPAKERTQLTPLLLAKVWISIHSILLRWGV